MCGATYAPYKTGELEDISTYWCELSGVDMPESGVCQFHNPTSKLFLNESSRSTQRS